MAGTGWVSSRPAGGDGTPSGRHSWSGASHPKHNSRAAFSVRTDADKGKRSRSGALPTALFRDVMHDRGGTGGATVSKHRPGQAYLANEMVVPVPKSAHPWLARVLS